MLKQRSDLTLVLWGLNSEPRLHFGWEIGTASPRAALVVADILGTLAPAAGTVGKNELAADHKYPFVSDTRGIYAAPSHSFVPAALRLA